MATQVAIIFFALCILGGFVLAAIIGVAIWWHRIKKHGGL